MTDDPSSPTTVHVDFGARGYDIIIGDGVLAELGIRLSAMLKRPRIFVVTDDTVEHLHMHALASSVKHVGITIEAHTIAAGEASKSLENLSAILDWLLEHGADRSDVLVAFGGGVVGDITGLAASLMKRGMGLVQVPTTLLAQVDSSVGGKTAINARQGKNLIGAFYQPRLVLADTGLLKTLPKRQIQAGFAEIAKYGLIDSPSFFAWLRDNLDDVMALSPDAIAYAVSESCRAKARIVAQDEREGGVRALLNLGHTFGHAIEAANGFAETVLHGEAVATGMVLAMRYSAETGVMPAPDAVRGAQLLSRAGLQTELPDMPGGPYTASDLIHHMQQDKKARAGRVPLILMRGIGAAYIHPDADLNAVETFLAEQLAGAGVSAT